MTITRRELALPAVALSLLAVVPAFAASSDEEAVAKNVEAFRAAQIAANPEVLGALCADELSYSTNLHILMNWIKQGSDWKLLSRASTKL